MSPKNENFLLGKKLTKLLIKASVRSVFFLDVSQSQPMKNLKRLERKTP